MLAQMLRAGGLTYNPAGGCGHVNQIDDVFGPDAEYPTAADVTAARAVPVRGGGKRPFVHGEFLKLTRSIIM